MTVGRKRSGSAARATRCGGRKPLTVEEILQLDAALVQAFGSIQGLRSRIDAARYIKFPPLPPIFSESIIVAATERLFGRGWQGAFGGRECDVRLTNSLIGACRSVEVKATGVHAFQELKSKDLRADVLIWIRFGDRFEKGSGPVEVVMIIEPGSLIPSPRRLDALRFERLVGSSANVTVFRFGSLEELISPAVGSGDGSAAPT